MNKKIIWIIVVVVIVIILIGGAGVGTAYYLGKQSKTTPTPSPSTSTRQTSAVPLSDTEQIKASHCLKNPNGGTGNITIADLAHYSQVSSPITFSGTANVFEATFLVRIVACDGTEIKKEIVTAQAVDVGVSSPYSATLTYDSSYAGTYATIEAYDLSAMDGSVQDTIQVPVYLK
ncbi:Gmad2 immunoglobulin-like domain-containing protein [Patescibacteria group bacterium]|nr:Gmad2 immunoglobulin-like domain-containing protein [Patescibacteria group bacterium]